MAAIAHHRWNLGHRKAGSVVRVELTGNAANVRLLDSSNYAAFAAGREHRYVGGQFKRSPATLKIPHDGLWNVVVDYGGGRGRGTASVTVQDASVV